MRQIFCNFHFPILINTIIVVVVVVIIIIITVVGTLPSVTELTFRAVRFDAEPILNFELFFIEVVADVFSPPLPCIQGVLFLFDGRPMEAAPEVVVAITAEVELLAKRFEACGIADSMSQLEMLPQMVLAGERSMGARSYAALPLILQKVLRALMALPIVATAEPFEASWECASVRPSMPFPVFPVDHKQCQF